MATIYKRTHTRGDGKKIDTFTANYVDQHGARQRKGGFKTRKAAQLWLIEAEGEVVRGLHTPERNGITITEMGRIYLQWCAAEGLAVMTLRHYKTLVELHIVKSKSGIGNVKLAKFDGPMAVAFRDWLVEQHKGRRGLAKRILGILRAIMRLAHQKGLVAQNVMLAVKIEIRRRDKKKLEVGVDIPDKPDIAKLLRASRMDCFPLFCYPFLVVAVGTGMRISEIRGLPWDAVDFTARKYPHGAITVRQSANDVGQIQDTTKTYAGQRTIPMVPTVAKALREWRQQVWWRNSNYSATTDQPRPPNPLNLVFPTRNGRPQDHVNLMTRLWHPLQRLVRLVKANNQPRYRFHRLRHFYASYWLDRGLSFDILKERMGHASIRETIDTYGHLIPGRRDDVAMFAEMEQELGMAPGDDAVVTPLAEVRVRSRERERQTRS
jgi:integrase